MPGNIRNSNTRRRMDLDYLQLNTGSGKFPNLSLRNPRVFASLGDQALSAMADESTRLQCLGRRTFQPSLWKA